MKDLHLLPRVRDSWSYLYLEHCRVEQENQAIAFHDADVTTPAGEADSVFDTDEALPGGI